MHGEVDNAVFEMASPLGLVAQDELMSNWAAAEFYTETGEMFSQETQMLLYSWLEDIDSAAQIKLKGYKGSLGDYFHHE